ncbi:MAG: fused response regulator/phosphatase [Myxococcaceae bacterium]
MPAASILVIEDDQHVRAALMTLLRQLGYRPTGALHGKEGLDTLRAGRRFDLILCDMRMPELDGVGFLKGLKQVPDAPPVIVMSGAGLLEDAVEALRLGAWDYLTKPILEVEVLSHTIGRALEKQALVAENRRVTDELKATLSVLAEGEEAGRQLQARMLPPNHQRFGAFEFSRELVPSVYLSGDFIDAFRLDERRWGFYLADVAGHGVSSALVTVLLRSAVQRHVEWAHHEDEALAASPARLLEALNEELGKEPLERHVTFFYGVVDEKADTLTWSSAGQFPAPLLFDGTRARRLEGAGLPLGMMPHSRYQQHVEPLGQRVVLSAVSDGVLEVLPAASLEEKLELLSQHFGRLDVTVEGARAALKLDEHSTLPDDVALLLVKRGGAHVEPGQLRAT